jgi:acetyl esterase/lipase
VVTYDPEARYAVDTFDVEYRRDNGQPWLARVCRPPGPGPFPAMMYVHGGQWSRGDRMGNAWVYEPLAASGIVVVSVDFRQAPAHPYPEPLEDINYATRWLKAHATEFGADPDTLGGLGTSSGGHQVMLSAMRPNDPRYAALPLAEGPDLDASMKYIVACWSILDPYARYLFAQDTRRDDIVAATEGYFGSVEAITEANPTELLRRGEAVALPPTLIIQGTADANVTPEIQQSFAAAFHDAGGSCQVEIFPDMPHGTTQWPDEQIDQAVGKITRFVSQQLA